MTVESGVNRGTQGIRRSIQRRDEGVADWASADATLLQKAIATASVRGGALRFGYSGDGGAYALGCYYNGEHWTEFIRPSDNLDTFLSDVIDWYEGQEPISKFTPGATQTRQNGRK